MPGIVNELTYLGPDRRRRLTDRRTDDRRVGLRQAQVFMDRRQGERRRHPDRRVRDTGLIGGLTDKAAKLSLEAE